ncbi:type IV toxin-antitoxin system AbiEi family antitoxin domain-containing protein [Nocardioides carbamazepini]|uniref:type IV toxin-antitoxin system AbiEi family antitoxin domain-containing protein n=1 Tax=Nocardioides carbamazepini TaxID=2854259 RepID=UPI002149B206|nr:type IV toxin-antitoxin system AbiEi family antitoxin domain-containing protein [Nocardioides carbamazepini]MCR1786258.1 type IV toxin-antitoxin system AbiEi family antitoxin domain-containing protein [Nocardioides carbamazepini]
MDPRVEAAIAANHGVISRAQALDLGVGPSAVRALLRDRVWVVVRRGVYTTRSIWEAFDEYVARPLLIARAATLNIQRGWVLSHDSACHLLGLPVLALTDPLVHITRPGWTNAWTRDGVGRHLARFGAAQVIEKDGLRALNHARTGVDMARTHGVRSGLVVCDAVLRTGGRRADLEAAAAIMENWPGRTHVATCIELADPGAETALESVTRELVIEAVGRRPETQFPVRTDRGIVWCDMVVGNHAVEADGRVKLRHRDRGGVADDAENAAWEAKLRERAIRDRGLVVSPVVWADHWNERRVATVERVRRAQAEADRVYGRETNPELLREAEEIRRVHGDRKTA